MKSPTRLYTAVAGIFLLLQGVSTLTFRLVPALDAAFPQLLAVTQMVPTHSILHILTGILALIVLFHGGEKGSLWFSLGFGAFYTSLALYGFITHMPTMFHLQLFDHPFHLFLGVLGLAAGGFYFYSNRK
ncbi:MAG TPA: DUF4383 domain-containing protein [Anaerolineales bacterium]|nr:DUF4383 domain-containing protein [Anaerolineales bacterium]HNM35476.1 DUF4383 domain-containing protein [Anaerolineales bacterium]